MNRKVINIEKIKTRWDTVEKIMEKRNEAIDLLEEAVSYDNIVTAEYWRGVIKSWTLTLNDLKILWELDDANS